jgi:hypothetical protein
MREIINSRSTLNFHIAPYASTLLNHLINGYYAVIRQDGALMIHRAAGIIANSYYVYTYLSYCPPARYADSRRFLMRVAIILLCMLSELHMLLPLFGLQRYFYGHLAVFAALTGIGLAASPLATVVSLRCSLSSERMQLDAREWAITASAFSWAPFSKQHGVPPVRAGAGHQLAAGVDRGCFPTRAADCAEIACDAAVTCWAMVVHLLACVHDVHLQREVITQRDSSSLPLGLCATVTIQCTSWAVYGYLKEDWSTFANNAVGVVLGSVQLGLIFMCPNKRRAGTPAKLKSELGRRCGSVRRLQLCELDRPRHFSARCERGQLVCACAAGSSSRVQVPQT